MGVFFPRTVVFVADFPIFEPVLFGYIRISHPGGGFRRRAGTVVDRGVYLRVDGLGHGGESIEIRGLRIGAGLVGLPVISVGRAAAGETQAPAC